MIRSCPGDILATPAEALVNPVNCVGVMGRGLALQVKRALPEVVAPYTRACRSGELQPGTVLAVDRGPAAAPRFIIHLPTKRHWREPSRPEDVADGLTALAAEVRRLGLGSVAVPPVGCGLGGLAWADVRPLVVAAFGGLPGVEVILYEPAGPVHLLSRPTTGPRWRSLTVGTPIVSRRVRT